MLTTLLQPGKPAQDEERYRYVFYRGEKERTEEDGIIQFFVYGRNLREAFRSLQELAGKELMGELMAKNQYCMYVMQCRKAQDPWIPEAV